MKRLLCFPLVLVTVMSVPAAAQTFGELFPLTNTRYREAAGLPRLVPNDRELFLFWSAEQKIRATQRRSPIQAAAARFTNLHFCPETPS